MTINLQTRYARRERKGARIFTVFNLVECPTCKNPAAYDFSTRRCATKKLTADGVVLQKDKYGDPLRYDLEQEKCSTCVRADDRDAAEKEAKELGFASAKNQEVFEAVEKALEREKSLGRYEREDYYSWKSNTRRDLRLKYLTNLMEDLINRKELSFYRPFVPTVLAVVENFNEQLTRDVLFAARSGNMDNQDKALEVEVKAGLLDTLESLIGNYLTGTEWKYRQRVPEETQA